MTLRIWALQAQFAFRRDIKKSAGYPEGEKSRKTLEFRGNPGNKNSKSEKNPESCG